jgi:hypothetical protein
VGASLGYVTGSGLLRGLVWAATREVPGDPTVALVLMLGRAMARLRERSRAGTLLGELPEDVVRPTGQTTLEIVCPRPHPELASGAGVEVDGHFYRVESVEPGREGRRAVFVHRLRELPPGNVLRRFVRYR